MGIFATRLAEEVRNRAEWLMDDDGRYEGRITPSGIRVNRQAALGLTTIWRCVDLLSSAVAQSPKDVILKIGGKSFPEFTKPSWLVSPDPLDPTYTIDDYFSQVALSLLFDGNYFVEVFPYIFDVQRLTVHDPGLIDVKRGPVYDIRNQQGQVVRTIGPMEMLHGTWIRPAGALRGVSPLEALRRGIGSSIAAEDHAGRFFGQGASLSFGVEVPGEMDEPKKTELARTFRRKYAGLQNSHAIGVLTGGAKFVTGLAPTPEQAQMLATRKYSVEDLCRPYGVPPSMAGSQEPGASSYASDEVKDKQFAERAVLPLAVRIEVQHNRLLQVPDHINDPSASVQFKFNLDAIARANILTRYQAYGEGIRGGVLTPHEARGKEDLQPVDPNAKDPGDKLYMQRQMVPLGDLATSSPIPGAPVDANIPLVTPEGGVRSVADDETEERRHVELVAALSREPSSVTVTPAPVVPFNVQPFAEIIAAAGDRSQEQIRSLAERLVSAFNQASVVPAPLVTVNVPQQTAEAPVVNVTNEVRSPDVNVTMPSEIAITSMPIRMSKRTVTKRNKDQSIAETIEVETDA